MLEWYKKKKHARIALKCGKVLNVYLLYAKHVLKRSFNVDDRREQLMRLAIAAHKQHGYMLSYACHLVGKGFIADGR